MAFWRTWVRALLGASGVTLLVPAGLLLAVALAATLGGAGLGGLGQLVSGPVLPGSEASAGLLPPTPAVNGGVAALPLTKHAGSRRAAGTTRHGSSSKPASNTPGGAPKHSSQLGPKGKPKPPVKHDPAPAPAPKPSLPPASPIDAVTAPVQAVTKPVKSTLQRIGAAVQKTVSAIPIVGPPVADAVGTVVDLLSGPTPRSR
jgi:hypothetical protein